MTKKELLKILHDCKLEGELYHIKADQALLDYINDPDVMEAFENIPKYYV